MRPESRSIPQSGDSLLRSPGRCDGGDDDLRGIEGQKQSVGLPLKILQKFRTERFDGFKPVGQGIDIVASAFYSVIQMRPCRLPGNADIPDYLAALNFNPAPDTSAKPPQMEIHCFVSVFMADSDHSSGCAVAAGVSDRSFSGSADGSPDRRGVVDTIVGAPDFSDGMEPAVTES